MDSADRGQMERALMTSACSAAGAYCYIYDITCPCAAVNEHCVTVAVHTIRKRRGVCTFLLNPVLHKVRTGVNVILSIPTQSLVSGSSSRQRHHTFARLILHARGAVPHDHGMMHDMVAPRGSMRQPAAQHQQVGHNGGPAWARAGKMHTYTYYTYMHGAPT